MSDAGSWSLLLVLVYLDSDSDSGVFGLLVFGNTDVSLDVVLYFNSATCRGQYRPCPMLRGFFV